MGTRTRGPRAGISKVNSGVILRNPPRTEPSLLALVGSSVIACIPLCTEPSLLAEHEDPIIGCLRDSSAERLLIRSWRNSEARDLWRGHKEGFDCGSGVEGSGGGGGRGDGDGVLTIGAAPRHGVIRELGLGGAARCDKYIKCLKYLGV
eukprot:1156358-Pelagomonas_calceolata.AAC.1